MKTKLVVLLLVLLGAGGSLFAQNLIFPVAGVVTVDVSPAKAPYEVFVNAVVTSVVFTNQTPGQIVTVLFLQDSTGHAVTFGGNILNACTVTATANALTSCQFQYDARTVQWTGLGGGGGSITSVGSLPATCTPGVTAPVQLSVAPFAIYYCSSLNVFSSTADVLRGVSCSNCKADLQDVFDATITNGSSTVTTSGGDIAFTSADTGKSCFATSGGTGGVLAHTTGKLSMAQGTFTFTTAHTGTCTTANANASGIANNIFIWASNDAAALTSAYSIVNQAGAVCGTFILPAHPFFTDTNFGAAANALCHEQISGGVDTGLAVFGFGLLSSLMVIGPNFDPTTCTGGTGNTCFFGGPGMSLQNFGIWGGERGDCPSTFNGKTFLSFGNDTNISYVLGVGWCAGNTNTSTGLSTTFGGAAQRISLDGFGNSSLNVSTFAPITNSFFGDSTNGVTSSGIFMSNTNDFADVVGAGAEIFVTGGSFQSVNDACIVISSGATLIGLRVESATARLINMDCDVSNSTGTLSAWAHTGGTISALNSIFKSGSSAGSDLLISVSGVFNDLCGNTFGNNKLNLFDTTSRLNSCPASVAQANLTSQTANIAATTLLTTGSTPNNGVYTLTYDVILVASGTTGTLAVNLICPNGTATSTQPGPATINITAAAGSETSGEVSCHAAVSSAIQYSTTGIVTPGALNYSLNLRLNPR